MSYNLLPPNATPLERAFAEASRLDDIAVDIETLWDAQRCPVQFLPWLAWSMSVDTWFDDWSEETKRAVIAGSIAWHRKKGTPWAVKQALAAIGYPESTLLEHRQLHDAWLMANGEILDGIGTINGDSTLSAPGGDFRFTTRHWAEYAIRLNIAEAGLTPQQQRQVIAVASAYAPARSHLVAIIQSLVIRFDASITLQSVRQLGRLRYADCRRFTVGEFDTLDGCDLIGGEDVDDTLDGLDTLDGGLLNGLRATGEALDAGQLGLRIGGAARYHLQAAGGDLVEPPETLNATQLLDGSDCIAGELLDGFGALDGADSLGYPTLISADNTLDGTSNLSAETAVSGIWHGGSITVRRGTSIYRETLQ